MAVRMEIEPEHRYREENIFLLALYFGRGKPSLGVIFNELLPDLHRAGRTGASL
jgi:hypothetical protein